MNKTPREQYSRKRVGYAPGLAEDVGTPHPTWKPPDQSFLQHTPEAKRRLVQPGLREHGKLAGLGRIVNPDMPKGYR